MRKSLNRVASIATSIAMVGSMLLTAAPVHAAAATVISDTLTREALNVAADHVLVFTAPAASWTDGQTVIFSYTAGGFTAGAGTPDVAGDATSTGTVAASPMAGGTLLTLTCTGTCAGNFTVGGVTPFTLNNPAAAGAATVTITGGTATVTGSYSIPIVASDQVTITASVAVSTTFDIDVQHATNTLPNATESGPIYAVDLGVITLGATRSSGTASGIDFIMLDVSSNASHGTVVTVHNANGARGLVSSSVPADDINSVTGTMAPGVENYGICSVDADSEGLGASGDLTPQAPYAGTPCIGDGQVNHVGGLTVAPQPIYSSGGLPITLGRAMISVNGDISTATASHNDYTDTLTFISTGTF